MIANTTATTPSKNRRFVQQLAWAGALLLGVAGCGQDSSPLQRPTTPPEVPTEAPPVIAAGPDQGAVSGLDFPGSLGVVNTMRFKFTDPHLNGLPAYGVPGGGVTYIWRAYPRQQAGYYTAFFWGNDDGRGTVDETFLSDNGRAHRYYGAHPYPRFGTSVHDWEVATEQRDDVNGQVVYGRWYTQALRVWSDASGKHHEFYWDLPNTDPAHVVSSRASAGWGNTDPPAPALTWGDAPWAPGREVWSGILRGIQVYSGLLSISDILIEADDPMSTAAGTSNIWYLNSNPKPTDISDKSGRGHNPVWVGPERPTLYSEGGGPQEPGNQSPTVAAAASANPNPVSGNTTSLTVLGADDGGEGALSYSWAVAGTPPAPVTFGANGVNGAKATTATFTRAGTYPLQATISDAQGLTVMSPTTVTVAPTLTTLSVTPTTATIAPGATQAFAAAGQDQFSQPMTATGVVWSVSGGGTINSSTGVFTAGSSPAGPVTITATAGSISATAQLTVAAAPLTVGETAVLGTTAAGVANLLVAQRATLTQSGTLQSISANVGTAAGQLRLGIYDATGPGGGPGVKRAETAQITPIAGWNTVAVLTPVTIPAGDYWLAWTTNSTTLALRGTNSGSATGYVRAYAALPATFSTTPTAGAHRWSLYATLSAAVAPPANQAPTLAAAASASPTPVIGTSTMLSVLGADDAGEPGLTYSWAAVGGPAAVVTFGSNRTNASKNTHATFTRAGSYPLEATVADLQSLAVTSRVMVTVTQALTGITVSPASATVAAGATQTFTAAATDQFNQPMTVAPSFVWSVSGGGTISSSGVFTAGSTAGPFTVTAAASGVSGTSSLTVTVTPPPPPPPPPATIVAGETSILGTASSGNANRLVTQRVTLAQAGTIESLSLYLTAAAGRLRLAVYDATGPNGGPGVRRGETAEFTPVVGWNTRPVTAQSALPAGTYWLAFFTDSDVVALRGEASGSAVGVLLPYTAMPATFSTTPLSGTFRWSFYATLH